MDRHCRTVPTSSSPSSRCSKTGDRLHHCRTLSAYRYRRDVATSSRPSSRCDSTLHPMYRPCTASSFHLHLLRAVPTSSPRSFRCGSKRDRMPNRYTPSKYQQQQHNHHRHYETLSAKSCYDLHPPASGSFSLLLPLRFRFHPLRFRFHPLRFRNLHHCQGTMQPVVRRRYRAWRLRPLLLPPLPQRHPCRCPLRLLRKDQPDRWPVERLRGGSSIPR
mmetsp:Transcript_18107/g.36474  ORF Transcript_18107/g.36474 Transcript_18107/m.36474 type:complete len:218 (+) Transcript_18107:289-942(+)